jgi:hypothetical protein
MEDDGTRWNTWGMQSLISEIHPSCSALILTLPETLKQNDDNELS